MRRNASGISIIITIMANVDIAPSPMPSMASFELQSSLAHPHPLIVSHALAVIETCSLLFDIYDLAWKSLCHIHAASHMSRHSMLDSSLSNADDDGQVHDYQRGPPQPDPEPAAPPYVQTPCHALSLIMTKKSYLSLPTWPLQKSRAAMY